MALVVGDRVFTAGERGVTARDDRTGAIVWRREDVGAHGIAYDIGRVFAVGDGITALNATSGATLWHAASGPFISPPVADGGELFVSVEQTIVRFDEETGAVVWSRRSQSSANRAPTLDATRVWPGNSCAPLLRASGDPAGPALDPCPNDGDSFVAPESAGHILLRDFQRSGTWFDYDTGRNAYTGVSFGGLPPAISGATIVVAGATVSGYTFPTMTPRWSYTVPEPDNLCCLPPLIVGRHVYFADNDYHFYALNLDSGALEWKVLGPYFWEYDTGAGPRSMAAGDGLLLVPTTGYLIAYESA
jgi:outer membrane protein assembly factor BamB